MRHALLIITISYFCKCTCWFAGMVAAQAVCSAAGVCHAFTTPAPCLLPAPGWSSGSAVVPKPCAFL